MSGERASVADLSALDSRGVGMRIRFFWNGDRYCHQIDVLNGPLVRTLLESVEGEDFNNWPPSPAFQQVNISWITSDTQQGHVAMLSGASGRSRWSMCVSAHDGRCYPRDKSSETELFFDVACRTEESPDYLGSTYRALFEQIAVSDRLNCAFVPADAAGLVIVPQDAQLELDARRTRSPILRCKATEMRFTESPATLRWRYAIRRSSGGPLRIAAKKRIRQG